jgi:hypothetical protein
MGGGVNGDAVITGIGAEATDATEATVAVVFLDGAADVVALGTIV